MWEANRNNGIHRLPKVCGADVELGNFILGSNKPWDTAGEAARALLQEIEGLPLPSPPSPHEFSMIIPNPSTQLEYPGSGYSPSHGWLSGGGCCNPYNPQDWGRKFLPRNGGCAYIDLDHLEICLPEVISAWDHVAAWNAMLRITRGALRKANKAQAPNRKIQVLANNSDGRNNSYGSHLNFLITRHAWDNLFHKKLHHLLYLATYQVSSIIFSGQGKVGSENQTTPVAYQLSQRADFFETLIGPQTTFNRPIVNSRDESLCGRGQNSAPECARLHVIFFDSTLAHVASLLKVGVTQIILSMIEAECVNPSLLLDDPVDALSRYSLDPTLQARAMTVPGRYLSALDLQSLFLEEASHFIARGGCEDIVPRADEILLLWEDTLQKLKRQDLAALSRRLDWVLKLQIIAHAMTQQPGLTWDSPQIRFLDQLYSSIDDSEGLYWNYEKNGFMERVVGEDQVGRFLENPPEDTRAWTRAMLLRHADPASVEQVDWDTITFIVRGRSYWPTRRALDLAHPLGYIRGTAEPCFRNAKSFEEILDALETLDYQSQPPGSDDTDFRSDQAITTH